MKLYVKKSKKTINFLNKIQELKNEKKEIVKSTCLLKKLTFFGHKIESNAKKQINRNTNSIKLKEEKIDELKSDFLLSYKNDYENTLNGVEIKEEKEVVTKEFVEEDPELQKLENILQAADDASIRLDIKLYKQILIRLKKIPNSFYYW